MEQYADDVEGRSKRSPKQDSVPPDGASGSAQSIKRDEKDTSLMGDNNGTTSFSHPSPASVGGWVSRTWNRIRGLTGS